MIKPDYYIIGGATVLEIYLLIIARRYMQISIEQLEDDEDFNR